MGSYLRKGKRKSNRVQNKKAIKKIKDTFSTSMELIYKYKSLGIKTTLEELQEEVGEDFPESVLVAVLNKINEEDVE